MFDVVFGVVMIVLGSALLVAFSNWHIWLGVLLISAGNIYALAKLMCMPRE